MSQVGSERQRETVDWETVDWRLAPGSARTPLRLCSAQLSSDCLGLLLTICEHVAKKCRQKTKFK